MIGGIAGGVAVLLAIGAFIYTRQKRRTKDDDENRHTLKLAQMYRPPAYEQDSSDATPKGVNPPPPDLAELLVVSKHVVQAVPGFYKATRNYEAESRGILNLTEGMRVYVTTMPNKDGWCTALMGRQEGWVHASNLELIG
jgi:hypothetical protein